MEDTIAAISTTTGIGAISIIRLSGEEALKITNKVFTKDLTTAASHTIHYGYIYDGEYWCPAYIGHDGWCEYDKSDIFEEQEITYDNARKYNN